MEKKTLGTIYDTDPTRRVREKRYTLGSVVSLSGGMVEVNVGATLPDGTPQNLIIPCASGFNPSVGDTVQVGYPTDSVHSAYAIGVGQSAANPPTSSSHDIFDHSNFLTALGTANQIPGMNAAATAWEYKAILGTTNQIVATHAAGSITLSLPQDMHTGASPTFAGATVNGYSLAFGERVKLGWVFGG